MTITESLLAEHAVLSAVFDQVGTLLPKLGTVAEIKVLTRLVTGLLDGHGETEKNLAYVALDHVLEDKGQLDRMHQDHHEIDARLRRAQTAPTVEEARRLLAMALRASREHFRLEERAVFPVLEKALQGQTLGELGNAWMQRYKPATPRRPAPPADTIPVSVAACG